MLIKYLPSYNNYFFNVVMSIFFFFTIFKNKKNKKNMSNSEINIKLNKKKNKYTESYVKKNNYDECIKCKAKIYNNKSTYYAFDNIWCYNCWCNIKL